MTPTNYPITSPTNSPTSYLSYTLSIPFPSILFDPPPPFLSHLTSSPPLPHPLSLPLPPPLLPPLPLLPHLFSLLFIIQTNRHHGGSHRNQRRHGCH